MRQFMDEFRSFFKKGDMVLLLLCLITTVFGVLIVASATRCTGSSRYIIVQIGAAIIGVFMYAIISSIDVESLAEHRVGMTVFNTVLLLMLYPFGVTIGGNRSWLHFPFLPINIQAAEICKITFIVIMASVMTAHQSRLSSVPSIFHMVFHLAILAGLNLVISGDAGVSLIFVFIFVGMAFAGGVSMFWFLLAGGGIAVTLPIAWKYILHDYQKIRIEVLYNPEIDPLGIDARYHAVRSLASLTGGGWTGQGLFHGIRTQAGALPAQHTDFVFSSIGEELGFLGCAFALLLMVLIITRCIYVGIHSQDQMRRLVCFGAAAALIFQVTINVGMCMGIMPVIGLTLPFISYGGSSLVTLYAMLGLVSGVHARPSPTSHERYIQPPRLPLR